MRTIWRSWLFQAFGLLLAATGAARGQAQSGIVHFANDLASGVNSPFYDTDGTSRLAGSTFRAALYMGMIGSPPESLIEVGAPQPFRVGPFAGYWTSVDIPLPVPPGSAVLLQVRFWDSADGAFATYEAAEANNARIGVSRTFSLVLNGGNPPTPTPMFGLSSSALVPILTLSRGAPGVVTDSAAVPIGTQLSSLCGVPVGTNRWFRFTSAYPGEAVVNTTGSAFDTVISSYQGSIVSPDTLTPIACNDDRAAGLATSEVRFVVEAAKLYLLCVAGKNGAAGTIQLNHTLATPLAIRRTQSGRVELSWPADATNFVAEAATNLFDFTPWRTLTNMPVTLTNRSLLQLDSAAPLEVYRLRLDSMP